MDKNTTSVSSGNYTPHSAAYDALKQQDLNHALEVVLNWNSSVMQPTDAGLAAALSKLRTKPIPDLHENLLLRDNLLTQLVGIITSSSLRQQCVDYSCRALDKICKRLLEGAGGGDQGEAYGFALKLLVEYMFAFEDFGNSENSVQIADAAYACATHTRWTILFGVVEDKLGAGVQVFGSKLGKN